MQSQNRSINKTHTKDLVETALLISLVFIATKFINFELPILSTGGLVHLGNTMLFTAAIVFGKEKGAISGGIGMALFDLTSGWVAWAPFTLIVRAIMAYIVGKIAWSKNNKGKNTLVNIVAIVIASIWMIIGYYITEVILYGNLLSPISSIPGNITQVIFGLIVAIPLSKALSKARL